MKIDYKPINRIETSFERLQRKMTNMKPQKKKRFAIIYFLSPLLILLLLKIFGVTYAISFVLFSMWICLMVLGIAVYVSTWIMKQDTGDEKMQEISNSIEEGAEGFFR